MGQGRAGGWDTCLDSSRLGSSLLKSQKSPTSYCPKSNKNIPAWLSYKLRLFWQCRILLNEKYKTTIKINFLGVNYIGSKHKLSPFIYKTVTAVCGDDLSDKIFCDLFAGTGIVGRTFKPYVKQVISNDIEYYSYVLNRDRKSTRLNSSHVRISYAVF